LTPLLKVEGLSAGYRDKVVLRDISFEVFPGESLALIGPNGSGKSTLLNSICGGVKPTAGEITLQGKSLQSQKSDEIARQIAFVPQDETPPFAFTVQEVVSMGRMVRGNGLFESDADRETVVRAMEIADCIHVAGRRMSEVSGGERQRALVARAIAQESDLLLLDEPTSHLDIAHQLGVADLVARHVADGGAAISAIHDLNLVSRMASRCILISQGQIAKAGSVEEVLASPELDQVFSVKFRRVELDGAMHLIAH
jgi:iron complex transport system ATP-binding protein